MFQLDLIHKDKTIILTQTGRRGPQGPPGTGDKNYTQTFDFVSSVLVNHNLNKYPAVTIIDSAGDEVVGDVKHIDKNQLTITFNAENTGKVFCN